MVYLVIEEYSWDGQHETNIKVFKTRENAKKEFDKIIERETTFSWVKDLIESKQCGDDYFDDILEIEEDSFYVYDSRNFDETSIRIVEQELN